MNMPIKIVTEHEFHGGIHPDEHKTDSNQTPIEFAGIPDKLVLPILQHIGSSAKIIVEVGERVLKGQVLAVADGAISVSVHASSSGVVSAIEERPVAHPSGMIDWCIEITTDGKDEWVELEAVDDISTLSKDEIRQRIRKAGIAGMGGAGFPSDIKLSPRKPIETLVLNAAECEPYITADDRLLQERSDQVLEGLELLADITEAKRCLVGIEDNKPEAIAALERAIEDANFKIPVQVVVVPTKYPSGGEKQLIKLLTGEEVPSGGLPADIGIVCHNVGTTLAIYRAVKFGEPLISRITTLTGEQIRQRGNVEVLLGTPINWLLEKYGYQADRTERVIMGGPMMGFALHDTSTPIVKVSNCILAPSIQELPLNDIAQACIRCGLCAEACPAELLPQQLYWFSRAQEYEKAEHHNLADCIECGACSYVCPSSIPLVQYYRHAKGEIRKHKADTAKSDKARIRFEARQERLEREKREKEEKRQARAAAAAAAQAKKAEEAITAPSSTNTAVSEASTQAATQAPTGPSSEQLVTESKEAWDKAQAKLDKMFDALDTAKQEGNTEQVTKLSRAVEKNQMRVNQAKLAYDKAVKEQAAEAAKTSEPAAEKPDIEALKTAWDKAQAKLEKMMDALKAAQDEGNEASVEKLSRAVDKNTSRVEQAKAAYEEAIAVSPAASKPDVIAEITPEELEQLKTAWEKAQNKLEKMEDALASAQDEGNEASIEKLTRAVDKNKVRVEQAQKSYEEAVAAQTLASQSEAAMTPEEIAQLEQAYEKAQIKLEKMAEALAAAQEENNEASVEKLTRAVEKNKVRVEAAKAAFEAAQSSNSDESTEATAPPTAQEAEPIDLDALKLAWDKAQLKLDKMHDALDAAKAEANGDDDNSEQIAKLTRAVEKNQVRVNAAKSAYEKAGGQ